VLPAQQLGYQVLVDGLFGEQHLLHGTAKLLIEQLGGDGTQDPEDPVGVEHAVGDQRVDVRVEGDQAPESLQELDDARPAVGIGLAIGVCEQAADDATELTQAMTMVEARAQYLRDGEDVLAVRHRSQDLLFDPLPVDEHPFLMAGKAEAAGLGGEGQQVLVTTLVAVDPGEAFVEVSAVEETLQGLVFDAAMDVFGLAQLVGMLADTAVQGGLARGLRGR